MKALCIGMLIVLFGSTCSGLQCYSCYDCSVPSAGQTCSLSGGGACFTMAVGGIIYRGCVPFAVEQCVGAGQFSLCYCTTDRCNNDHPSNLPVPSPGPQRGLSCYQCHDCDTPIGLRACPSGASNYCTITEFDGVISRGCSPLGLDECVDVGTIRACYCETDACNSGRGGTNVPSDPGQQTLRCYQCNDCDTPTGLDVCPSYANQYCTVTKSAGLTSRGCSLSGFDECFETSGVSVCYCREDGCNGAAELLASSVVFIAVAIAAKIVF